MALALIKMATPSTERNRPEHTIGKCSPALAMLVLDRPNTNPVSNNAHAHDTGGDEADEHQGSAVGRVHEHHRVFRQRRLQRRVLRVRADVAEIIRLAAEFQVRPRGPSVPSAETATAGKSYFPSGSAKR